MTSDTTTEGRASVAQLRARIRFHRNHLNRHLDALADPGIGPVEMAHRRARCLEDQAQLELALAELHVHPDFAAAE